MSNLIITIGRQCGSGGRAIGNRLAEKLNIKCYDKELLTLAAKQSGLCKELFETHDERPTNSFLYSLVMDTYSMGYTTSSFLDMPLNHKVFLAQFDTIKKLAEEESCIIVGRCADYALADHPNMTSVFISADMDAKIERIAKLYEMTKDKAKDTIIKTDKKRSSYYNYYSNKKWGDVGSYDLCLNSTRLGIEGTVDLILEYIKIKDRIRRK
ncbi:cytidylate kinase [Clostridiales bacterium CHKCI001]|nr:cytidylate kinase [Clostridiales bacterium CHKCI001]